MMLRDPAGGWMISHNSYTEKVFDAADMDVLPSWLDLASGSDTGYTVAVSNGLAVVTSATPPGAGSDKIVDMRCLINGGQVDLSDTNIQAVALYLENAWWGSQLGNWRFGFFDQPIGTNPTKGAHFVHVAGGSGSMNLRFNNPGAGTGYSELTNLPGPASSNTVNYLNHTNFGMVLTRFRDPGRTPANDAWFAYQMMSWDWRRRSGQEAWVRRGKATPITGAITGGAAGGDMSPGLVWPRIYFKTNGNTTPIVLNFRRLTVGAWFL
jgi:hypothetical protein